MKESKNEEKVDLKGSINTENSVQSPLLNSIRALSVVAMAVMLSFLVGHYVVAPFLKWLSSFRFVYGMLLGMNMAFLFFLLFRHFILASQNEEEKQQAIAQIPKTPGEVSDLGVRTGLDFCIAMYYYFLYDYKPIYSVNSNSMVEINDEEPWTKALGLFESMFHRMPANYSENGNKSWIVFADGELRKRLNMSDRATVPGEEILNALSPELRTHFGISTDDGGLVLQNFKDPILDSLNNIKNEDDDA